MQPRRTVPYMTPPLPPQFHQIPGVGEQVARPRHDFHADRRRDEAL